MCYISLHKANLFHSSSSCEDCFVVTSRFVMLFLGAFQETLRKLLPGFVTTNEETDWLESSKVD